MPAAAEGTRGRRASAVVESGPYALQVETETPGNVDLEGPVHAADRMGKGGSAHHLRREHPLTRTFAFIEQGPVEANHLAGPGDAARPRDQGRLCFGVEIGVARFDQLEQGHGDEALRRAPPRIARIEIRIFSDGASKTRSLRPSTATWIDGRSPSETSTQTRCQRPAK